MALMNYLKRLRMQAIGGGGKDAFILKRMQRDQLNEQAFEKVLFEG